jgi:hypothetical protein
MDVREMTSGYALGRIGIGAAMLVAPGLVGRSWVGAVGGTPGARVMATAVGARDVAIGLGLLRGLEADAGPRPWLRAAVLADAADLAATIRARDAIPRAAVLGIGALAGGSAAFGLVAERVLGQSAP